MPGVLYRLSIAWTLAMVISCVRSSEGLEESSEGLEEKFRTHENNLEAAFTAFTSKYFDMRVALGRPTSDSKAVTMYENPFYIGDGEIPDDFDQYGNPRPSRIHRAYQLVYIHDKVRVMTVKQVFDDVNHVEDIVRGQMYVLSKINYSKLNQLFRERTFAYSMYALVRAFLFLETAKTDSPIFTSLIGDTKSSIANLRDVYINFLNVIPDRFVLGRWKRDPWLPLDFQIPDPSLSSNEHVVSLLHQAFIEVLSEKHSPSLYSNNQFKLDMFPLYEKQLKSWLKMMTRCLVNGNSWEGQITYDDFPTETRNVDPDEMELEQRRVNERERERERELQERARGKQKVVSHEGPSSSSWDRDS